MRRGGILRKGRARCAAGDEGGRAGWGGWVVGRMRTATNVGRGGIGRTQNGIYIGRITYGALWVRKNIDGSVADRHRMELHNCAELCRRLQTISMFSQRSWWDMHWPATWGLHGDGGGPTAALTDQIQTSYQSHNGHIRKGAGDMSSHRGC